MRFFGRYPAAPRWVNALHWLMETLDYKVIYPMSSWLMYKRMDLLNRFCRCEKCLKREQEKREEALRAALRAICP